MSRSPVAGLLLWARPVVDMDRFSSIAALPALRQYGAQQHVRVVTRAFEFAIRIYSIRFVMRIDSFSKKNRPFDLLVVVQFFLVYLLYGLSQKIS